MLPMQMEKLNSQYFVNVNYILITTKMIMI